MKGTKQLVLIIMGVFSLATTGAAETREPSHWNASFAWGVTAFGESDAHRTLGATMRIRLGERWSLEPEFGYATVPDTSHESSIGRSGNKHSDILVTARAVYDFRNEAEASFIPYVTFGGGWIRSQFEHTLTRATVDNAVPVFPIAPPSDSGSWKTSNDNLWLGGAFGLRIVLPHGLFLSPEVSLGTAGGEVVSSAVIKVGYGF